MMKVTASAGQSYSYYSGNDGTDKDPQVVKSLNGKACYIVLTFFCPCAVFILSLDFKSRLWLKEKYCESG